MPHRRLRGIVRRLRLRHVDDASGHAADHDDAARGLSLHEMLRHPDRKEVGPVDVDAPQLLDPVIGVRDGIKVLRESSRSDQVVDLAMVTDDIGNCRVDRLGRRDICIMSGDFGKSAECQKLGSTPRIQGRGRTVQTYCSEPGFSLMKCAIKPLACLSASSSVKTAP